MKPFKIKTTNLDRPSQIRVGNFATFPMLTAREVWPRVSNETLTASLRQFDLENLLVTLARINLYLHQSDNISEYDRHLKGKYCPYHLRKKIANRRLDLDDCNIFNRGSTLYLLSEGVKVANLHSSCARDNIDNVGKELGKCYLIANALSEGTESESAPIDERNTRLLTGLMAVWEYAIYTVPFELVKKSLVRTEKFLTYAEKIPSKFDIHTLFHQATGLTVREYQYLIYGILCMVLQFSQAELLEDCELFIDVNPSPTIAPLYDKLLQHTCISINKVAHALEAETKDSLPNEFRLWRKYPLVESTDGKVFPIDYGFLKDKLDTGVFWIVLHQIEVKRTGKGSDIISLWGSAFEKYALSIVERGINAQTQPRMETVIPNPKYNPTEECIDIAVRGSQTLILFECKAPVLTAQTKLSSDFSDFYSGIRSKLIEGAGITQLSRAIRNLCHANNTERRNVQEIDMSQVKKVYPVLLLSDRVFSLVYMNEFFSSEFERQVNRDELDSGIEVSSLTVLTIDELENLEPYLRDTPFFAQLDEYEWLKVRNCKESLPFTAHLHSLMQKEPRENSHIEQEFRRIHGDMAEYFTSHGIKWQNLS